MKLRKVLPHQASLIDACDRRLAHIISDLRDAGATKAAAAVSRARKSVGGAFRHARRCVTSSATDKLIAFGRKGGQATSARKVIAAKKNGSAPAGPGKRRGWVPGRPRKPLPPPP